MLKHSGPVISYFLSNQLMNMIIHENPEKQAQSKSHYHQQSAPLLQSDEGGCSRGAALGNNTKSTPAILTVNEKAIYRALVRRKRYDLLRASQSVLQDHRVKGCSHHPGIIGKGEVGAGNMREYVSLKKSEGKAYWSGISVCGSVWVCPVCSTKIMLIRKDEVLEALSKHRVTGGRNLLITYTFSHKRFDDLVEIMKKFSKALTRMKASRAYKTIKSDLGYIGSIRALETTHGKNGWHPHTHEIMFISDKVKQEKVKEIEKDLLNLWIKYAVKYGLGRPSLERGLRIDYRESDGDDLAIGAYITKWADELTSGQSKAGREGSRTPWQILEELQTEWTWQNSKLWKEYAKAFHGRSAVFWSPGLKKMFGINQKSDELIAEEDETVKIDDLLKVTRAEFYAIVRMRKQAQVLERFEVSAEEASLYIDRIVQEDFDRRKADRNRYLALERTIRNSTNAALKKMGLH